MSTTTTRRPAPGKSAGLAVSTPLWNALLISAAVAAGLWILVSSGRLSWPPSLLLSSSFTVAGCIALVGPIVMARRDSTEGGLGEWLWMTAGLLVWLYDLAALLRGGLRAHAWATPVPAPTLGIVVLAVLVAGWRLGAGAGNRAWSWTNVLGWILGIYWIGMGVHALLPPASSALLR